MAAEIRKLSDRLGGIDATWKALEADQSNRRDNPNSPPNPELIPISKANHELKDLLLEVRPPEWLIKTHYNDTVSAIENLDILNHPERSQKWAIMDEHTPERRSQIINEAAELMGKGMGLDKPSRFGQYKPNTKRYGMELMPTPDSYQVWPNQPVGEKDASKQTRFAEIGAFEQHIPLLCHEFSHAKQIQILQDPKSPRSDYLDLLRFQMASRLAFIGNQSAPFGPMKRPAEPAFYLLSPQTFSAGYNALPQEMGADYARVVAVQQLSKALGKSTTIKGGHFEKLLQWPQEPNGSEGIK